MMTDDDHRRTDSEQSSICRFQMAFQDILMAGDNFKNANNNQTKPAKLNEGKLIKDAKENCSKKEMSTRKVIANTIYRLKT